MHVSNTRIFQKHTCMMSESCKPQYSFCLLPYLTENFRTRVSSNYFLTFESLSLRLVDFKLKAPPGTTSPSITTHAPSGQRNCT